MEAEDCIYIIESFFTREGAVLPSYSEILERALRFDAPGVQLGFALFQER